MPVSLGLIELFVLMLLVAFLLPKQTPERADQTGSTPTKVTKHARHLRNGSLGALIALPVLSFFVVAELGLKPARAYAYMLMAIGLPIIYLLALLVAKLMDPSPYQEYMKLIRGNTQISSRSMAIIVAALSILLAAFSFALFARYST